MGKCKTAATSRRLDLAPSAADPGRRALLAGGLAAALALGACQARPNTGQSAVSDGMRFEYGLAPAAQVAEHAPTHAEGEMHGGPPNAPGAYHVTLALFDTRSGARITDATASLNVTGPGHPGVVRVRLEPMTVASDVTYGGYVALPKANAAYRLTFNARRPTGSARAVFETQPPGG